MLAEGSVISSSMKHLAIPLQFTAAAESAIFDTNARNRYSCIKLLDTFAHSKTNALQNPNIVNLVVHWHISNAVAST